MGVQIGKPDDPSVRNVTDYSPKGVILYTRFSRLVPNLTRKGVGQIDLFKIHHPDDDLTYMSYVTRRDPLTSLARALELEAHLCPSWADSEGNFQSLFDTVQGVLC